MRSQAWPTQVIDLTRQEGAQMNDTLAVILAGGKGTRLEPLTRDRAQTRRSLRRQLSHHRFRSFQLPQ